MTFTVNWTEAALQQLAAIWLAAADRNAVTVASEEIDRELRVDPDTLGRATFATVREYKRPLSRSSSKSWNRTELFTSSRCGPFPEKMVLQLFLDRLRSAGTQ
jgi:plasmid stabilization system protein ParE